MDPIACLESGRSKVVGLDAAYRVRSEDKSLAFPAAPSGVFSMVYPFEVDGLAGS